MTYHTDPERRDRGRGGARGLIAIIGVLVFALALAACGSSDSSSSSTSSNASSTTGGSASTGVKTAQQQLAPFQAAPTKIVITQPLKSAPPKGKKLVMLATADPNNVKLQKSLKSLAGMVNWSYDQVSYDPANPATRQAELQRLFNLLLARRRAFLNHELFGNLAEFPALLPHLQGR